MSCQVIGVRVTNKQIPEEITHIAYEGPGYNPKVIISIEEAIARIADNKSEFYIVSLNRRCFLTGMKHSGGKSYIQSVSVRGKDYLFRLQRC